MLTATVIILAVFVLVEGIIIFSFDQEIKYLRKQLKSKTVIAVEGHKDISTCHFCGKDSGDLTVSKSGFYCCKYCLVTVLNQVNSNVTA